MIYIVQDLEIHEKQCRRITIHALWVQDEKMKSDDNVEKLIYRESFIIR